MTRPPSLPSVVLVIPNSRWHDRRPWVMLPHSALILTALLRHECHWTILDANITNMSQEECAARLEALRPEAVLVSAFAVEYHRQYHTVMAMAKAIRADLPTALGGVYPTVLGEEALADPNVDFIFVGHAEERVGDFLRLLLARDHASLRSMPGIGYRNPEGTIHINPVSTNISSVARLAVPDYSYLDVSAYARQFSTRDYQFNSDRPSAPIISSYGCPYNCSFCASRTISGRGVVFRPVPDVLAEIDFLHGQHGVSNLVFLDDCLLADRSRIETILNALIERNLDLTWKAATVSAWHLDDALLELMRRSGCTQVTLSVESGSQRVLKEVMHKPLRLAIIPGLVEKARSLGIDVGANFVIGSPGETWDELRQSFRFAEECNFDLVHFHIATPLPKTDLYRTAREQGLLAADFSFMDPNFFGYGRGHLNTDEFTAGELMVLRAYEWDRINFSTPAKTTKVAQMMGLSHAELREHRKQTRLKCGVHF